MKKWNAAELVEMNIAETANGCFPFFFESCLTHGVSCGCPGDKGDEGNDKGDNDNVPENKLS